MTDDLRDLVDPLLTDPPHPAPPLDELRNRVADRHRRRARAIGAASVLAVALVAATVLALPRATEVETGGRSGTSTMAAPPPLQTGPVRIEVMPDSAPLDSARVITVSNSDDQPYDTCGFSYDLYRWDDGAWQPVSGIFLGTNPPVLSQYSPSAVRGDCSVTTVAPGSGESMGFRIADATWHPIDGTTPPRTDQLTVGLYELREQHGYTDVDPPALGRFEISPADGPTKYPPPYESEPVMLLVRPEGAALDADRTLEIQNTSDEPYVECGWAYAVDRWDGYRWQPTALLHATDAGPQLEENPDMPRELQCATLDPIAPGASRSFPFDLGAARWQPTDGTTPPRTERLDPGVYRLRPRPGADSDLGAIGVFEIIDPDGPLGPGRPPPDTSEIGPDETSG